MVKIYCTTTAGRKSDLFDEGTTIREVFEAFDVDYSTATNTIDGTKIDPAGMNKSLREWGVTKEARLSSIVKIDNAAHVDISGASAVLVSEVALADWQRVEKFNPEELVILNEEKEPIFKVVTACEGPGSVNEYGVCFGAYTNEGGKATVTVLLDEEIDDKREAVREIMGTALLTLNEIEQKIPELLEKIALKEAKIDELIMAK
jgi:hypothetical protein